MTFLERLKFAFSRKDSQARALIALSNGGKYVPTPRDYQGFAVEGFQNNVIAYRAISLVSRNLSTIPWVLYKKAKGKKSKRQEIESHPLLDLLDRPNPMQGSSQFLEAVEGFKLISGNSYINAVGPALGSMKKITELWTNRPDRMTILPGTRGYPQAYVYKVGGLETRYLVDQVNLVSPMLHLKYFHPTNDWYGLSPMEAAAMSVDQHTGANKWNAGLLQNSARPSGALVATPSERSSGLLTDEQYDRLQKQLDDRMSGAENAGRPFILDGGLDWKPMSFSPQALEWLEAKNTSAREVAMAFGVPPQLLSIPGDNTYSNYQEARVALIQDTVLPEHDFIRDELNHWLVPSFGDGLELDSDKDAIHALAPVRQTVWEKVSSATWLTVNEKREATGYEEIGPEGDVILTPATSVSLEQVLEEPEPQVPMPTVAPGGAKPVPDSGANDDPDPDDDTPPGKMLEAKLFNLTSEKAKQREARGQLRLRARFSKRLHRQAQATFDMEGHTIAELVKGLDADHAKHVASREIDANKSQWARILTANLTATAKGFGDRTLAAFKSAPGAIELKDSTSAFDVWLKGWVKEHVGKRITQIADTSKERVIKAIQDAQNDGYDQGEGVDSLAAKIQGVYSEFSDSRAMTIARTETGSAANEALREAAKSSGVPNLQKEWVAVNDARTRGDHAEVGGTVIDMDEDFDVGGSKMTGPMDPNGPPEEVINCRCATVFSRGESSDDENGAEAAAAG